MLRFKDFLLLQIIKNALQSVYNGIRPFSLYKLIPRQMVVPARLIRYEYVKSISDQHLREQVHARCSIPSRE